MNNTNVPRVPTKEQQARVVALSMPIIGWFESLFLSVLFSNASLTELFYQSDPLVADGFTKVGSISVVVAAGMLGALMLHLYSLFIAHKLGDKKVKMIVAIMLVLFILAILFILPIGIIDVSGGIAGTQDTLHVSLFPLLQMM